jgi:hypothetical protein
MIISVTKYIDVIEPVLRKNNWMSIPNAKTTPHPEYNGPWKPFPYWKIEFDDPKEETMFILKYLEFTG